MKAEFFAEPERQMYTVDIYLHYTFYTGQNSELQIYFIRLHASQPQRFIFCAKGSGGPPGPAKFDRAVEARFPLICT